MRSYNGFSPKQRLDAYQWLKNEILHGRRSVATQCDHCGQDEGVIDLHSENYSWPYGDHIGQYQLCYVCHMMLHCRFKCPEAAKIYSNHISNGKRAPAFLTRNWFLFQKLFLKELCKNIDWQ